jgi:hypothetical protein
LLKLPEENLLTLSLKITLRYDNKHMIHKERSW